MINYNFLDPKNAIIQNNLEMDITAYLKFLLPIDNYSVNHGEIIMERHDEKYSEIYVISDIQKNSEKTITITKS